MKTLIILLEQTFLTNKQNTIDMQKITRIGKLFTLALLTISYVTLLGCGSSENKPAERQAYVIPDSLFKTLAIDTVTKTQLDNSITFSGKVAFNDDNVVNVFPMVSGVIQDIKVMLGDYVSAGQTLAVIKSAEMAQMSSDLLNAETNLRLAEKTLDKTKDMYKSGLASLTDSLSAEVSVQQAKAELTRVHRVLKINGDNKEGDYVIKAPVSGFIVQKLVTNNTAIRVDNSTNLFTISDLKNVWVLANVYESNIGNVHLNDPVEVTTLSYPGRIYKGKVDKVFNVLDPTNKVMRLRVVLDNPDYALKPEMFANISISSTENKQVLAIPTSALIFDHSQYYVLLVKSPKDVEIAPVKVINKVGDKTYIESGVTEGSKIIGSQTILIYDALNS